MKRLQRQLEAKSEEVNASLKLQAQAQEAHNKSLGEVQTQRDLLMADVARLTRSLKNVRPFITALDWTPGASIDAVALAAQLTPVIKPQQLSLFG